MLRDSLWIRATLAFTLVCAGAAPCVAATTGTAFGAGNAYADQIRTVNPLIAKRQSRAYADALLVNARRMNVDPHSPRANIRGITVYLHQLLTMFKSSRQSIRDAIAGYNAGPYAVTSGTVPRRGETRRYVVKVLAAWHAFAQRLGPNPHPAQIAAVLDAAELVASDQRAYWGVR